jgi:ferrous iron transport protein B
MRLALAGNPNCGKTTLFNALCGTRAKVGNYPGVTVERKEGHLRLPSGQAAVLTDLPGCYSLTARSPEEEVAFEVLAGTGSSSGTGTGTGSSSSGSGGVAPDAVICVVDATQLARSLYLVLQLKEMGLPLLVALNMMDVAQAQHIGIDLAALQKRLGVPVLPLCARSRAGCEDLLRAVEGLATVAAKAGGAVPAAIEDRATSSEHTPIEPWGAAPPAALAHLEIKPPQWQAVAHLAQQLNLAPRQAGRCLWLLCSEPQALHVGLPEGVDAARAGALIAAAQQLLAASPPAAHGGQQSFGRQLIAARYSWIDATLSAVLQLHAARADRNTAAWDAYLLHPLLGPLLFLGTMFVLFQAVFAWAQPLMQAVEWGVAVVAEQAQAVLPEGLFVSLLIHGVLAGIGSVLAFVPQIGLLFLGITALEESGYMARAAFLLDAVMRRAGLHGKAFIPLLGSFACAVPGIMAARTIESRRDRLVTILVAPFMSCSARLPVYTLVIAAVFAGMPPLWGVLSVGGLCIFAMYLLGFVAAIGTAFVLKRTVLRAPAPPLILDLPRLQLPGLADVLRTVLLRCRIFVLQTGRVILALSVLLWALLTFPQQGLPTEQMQAEQMRVAQLPGDAQAAATQALGLMDRAYRLEHSLGGRLGHAIEPLIAPLGFDWRIGIGLVASFAAREVLVSTLGQVYALHDPGAGHADSPAAAGSAMSLHTALQRDLDPATGAPRFTPLVGVSLMVFFVLAMQCLSTVATVRRETNSWTWPVAQLVYMNALAYGASLAVYQGGRLLGVG